MVLNFNVFLPRVKYQILSKFYGASIVAVNCDSSKINSIITQMLFYLNYMCTTTTSNYFSCGYLDTCLFLVMLRHMWLTKKITHTLSTFLNQFTIRKIGIIVFNKVQSIPLWYHKPLSGVLVRYLMMRLTIVMCKSLGFSWKCVHIKIKTWYQDDIQ